MKEPRYPEFNFWTTEENEEIILHLFCRVSDVKALSKSITLPKDLTVEENLKVTLEKVNILLKSAKDEMNNDFFKTN